MYVHVYTGTTTGEIFAIRKRARSFLIWKVLIAGPREPEVPFKKKEMNDCLSLRACRELLVTVTSYVPCIYSILSMFKLAARAE